jgi:hypothetical protein
MRGKTRPEEFDYIGRRLRPVLRRLRKDAEARNHFLEYAQARGGDYTLNVQRLLRTRLVSRDPQYAPFFVLMLAEYGLRHGWIKFAEETHPPKARPARPRRPSRRGRRDAPRKPKRLRR